MDAKEVEYTKEKEVLEVHPSHCGLMVDESATT